MRVLTLLLTVFLLFPVATAFTVSDTNIYPGEPFSAVHCKNITQTCSTITKETTVDWNQSCSLTVYNTEGTTCQQTTVKGAYRQQIVDIHNYKALLEENIENQAQSSDALSIAHRLRAKEALNRSTAEERRTLQQIRNNDYKCWPRDQCELSTTIQILEQLSEAGYDRDDRIYDDGLTWVEAQQNSFQNEEWQLEIRPDFGQSDVCPEGSKGNAEDGCYVGTGDNRNSVETVKANEVATCTASLGGDQIYEESNDSGPFRTTFTYNANEVLNVSCNYDYSVRVTDYFGDTQYVTTQDSTDTAQYLLPGGCWPADDNNRICSIDSTARALNLNELSASNRDAGTDWVDANVQRSRITGQRLENQETTLTHIYLYEATQNQELLDWLLYRQNNDGSFGTSNQLITTLEALNVINERPQWMNDARSWASNQEPSRLRESTFLYERFRPDTPISTFSPSYIATGRESVSADVEPGLDRANISIDPSIQGDISADYADTFNVDVATSQTGYHSGYVTLDAASTDYEIPVRASIQPDIDISYDRQYYHQRRSGTIRPTVTKSNDQMNCTITHSAFYDFVDQDLADNTQIVVPYSDVQQGTQSVQSVATCETEHGVITDENSFQATYYPTPPFTTSLTDTNITGVETLTVTNQIPENITVNLGFEQDNLYYRVPGQVTIPPGHHADIPLYQDTSVQQPQADQNTLNLQTLGYEDQATLTYQLNNQTYSRSPRYTVEEPTSYAAWLAGGLLLISLGGAAFLLYRAQRDEEDEESGDDEELVLAEVDAYLNQELGESLEETEEELREQGFDEETIDETESFLDEITESLDATIDETEDNV